MQVEKTVFISYRRTNVFNALAIYQNLTTHGFDVFFDYESIKSGDFSQIILNQIAARAHFVVLLTPSALERCNEPGDWLRREIEHALETKRNIVPLTFEGFSFKDAQQYLTGKLSVLLDYNALSVPVTYFDAAMERLRKDFLNISLDVVLHPIPHADRAAVEQIQATAEQQPTPNERQLTAEEYFERAEEKFKLENWEGVIADCDEAIHLNPQYPAPYFRRGAAKGNLGDLEGEFADVDKAIELGTKDSRAYHNRGNAYYNQGNYDAAIVDYTEAIRLNPLDAVPYNNRGIAQYSKRNYNEAIADYTEAIGINPQYANAYNNRGVVHYDTGDYNEAIADYTEAIGINPQYANAYSNRGETNFALQQYDEALHDLNNANQLRPDYRMTIGGLAITHHALGNISQAVQLWQSLVLQDVKYKDLDWVKKEFNWAAPLVEEARKVIARL